jgi:DNA-binding transcriptional MerR regulator
MRRPSEQSMQLSPRDFGARIQRSVRTLQRWAKQGLLVPHRLPSGRPFYDETHLAAALSIPTSPPQEP